MLNRLYSFARAHFSTSLTKWADNFIRDVFIRTLQTGEIPQHVAFIMDGNRRYAKSKSEKLEFGHEQGAAALLQVIDSCLKLGISHVSMYAFSIENFNRSQQEVDTLFSLLKDKMEQFLNSSEKFSKGARIRVIGNRSLFPKETLAKLEEIEKITAGNTNITLNVCFAYTSRDEIATAMRRTVDQVLDQEIALKKIQQFDLENNFYYPPDTPPLDLLIRTSGQTRLSDYLVWQSNESTDIVFISVLWPSFTAFHLYYILMKWGFEKKIGDKMESYESFLFKKFETISAPIKKVSLSELPPPPPRITITGKVFTH